jgi:L-threonylcarbamoyladenylate synthase
MSHSNIFDSDLQNSLSVLNNGGIIIYPTDTIWGIGCDATHVEAVENIYRIKKREPSQSMLILAADTLMLEQYVVEIPEEALQLIKKAENPITVIYPKAKNLPENLLAADGSIGIRIPKDEFCLQLIRKLGKPIVSTSANFSGKSFPRNFSEIDPDLLKIVDYTVRWRQEDLKPALPSSIYKIEPGGKITTIRK